MSVGGKSSARLSRNERRESRRLLRRLLCQGRRRRTFFGFGEATIPEATTTMACLGGEIPPMKASLVDAVSQCRRIKKVPAWLVGVNQAQRAASRRQPFSGGGLNRGGKLNAKRFCELIRGLIPAVREGSLVSAPSKVSDIG